MDKSTDELNKASHALLDAQIRLQTVQVQRLQLEKDIAILIAVQANLEENIRILKRKRAIVTAIEYRKSTTDLKTCLTRQAFLRMDCENVLKVERHAEFIYEKAKFEYDRIFNLIHNPPNNVIMVDFRKKNDT